jgi:dehydrogenase/reductase SDR family protein 7B
LSQSIAAHMITDGGGAIGVISSVQGKLGIPWRTSYAASKHALQGYFDGLRAELASKSVSVTIVSPGYVRTSLSLNALNADGSLYNKMDDTTAGGMEATTVAEKILVSIARKETDIVLADAKTTAAVQMKATLPDVVAWIMTKRARS